MKKNALILGLFAALGGSAWAASPSIMIVRGARVLSVDCFAPHHANHDWAAAGRVKLALADGNAASSEAFITFSRFADDDQMKAEAAALCQKLRSVSKSHKSVDLLYRIENEAMAIKGVTKILTLDDSLDNG